jgi:hypothetical protein
MVGGFDFANGVEGSGLWHSGDIFIDVDGGLLLRIGSGSLVALDR